MNLGPHDVDAILRFLLELYAPRTLEEFSKCLARLLTEVVHAQRGSALTATVSPPLDRFDLTPRETEVAFWLACGKTNWEIGTICRLSVRTAEKHVERVLRKLHVENRATAALKLRDAGYAVPPTNVSPAPAT
jgi:DNA-binding NarL/FixJ family response regulator